MLNIMNNHDILSNIVKAAIQKKTVIITYKDSKGVTSERETEPYEVRGNVYWGYCLSKNSIRQFSLANVTAAQITKKTYTPRWEVKIT